MKICKQCGKHFTGTRSFCSETCSRKYYSTGGDPFRKKEFLLKVDECKKILESMEFNLNTSHKGRIKNSSLKRMFCYICFKLKKYSSVVTGTALEIDHTTVFHHIKKITKDEIELAKILASSEDYEAPEIKPKQNIYERTGFRYDNGKKEVSTVWKRVYGIQRQRGCLSWGL